MSELPFNSTVDSKVYPLYDTCHTFVSGHLDHLTGKILTIIDASFSDPTQRKAVKDIIKEAIQADRINIRDSIAFKFYQVAEKFNDSWKCTEFEGSSLPFQQ